MAYSAERLLRAQRLFDRSTNQFSMLPQLAGPYHLRERASKRAAGLASGHDSDGDEDYEPPKRRTPSKRKLPIFHPDRATRPSKRARSFSPIHSSRSELTFKLETDISAVPSTPSQHSEPDSWDRYWAVDPDTIERNSGYSLRRRNKKTSPGSSQEDKPTSPETSIQAIPGDTLPTRGETPLRECSACQYLGLECSLSSDPDQFAYPCATCVQDDVSCVVSPQPRWKRTCESCKGRRKEVCSYRYPDYDHTLPCQPCINHGFKCVAGPAKYSPIESLSASEPSEPRSPTSTDSPPTSSPPHCTPEPSVPEDQKRLLSSSPPKAKSPATSISPHEVAVSFLVEASAPGITGDCLKVSTSPHGTPAGLVVQEAQLRNTVNIHSPESPSRLHGIAISSIIERPISDDVIIILDSDEDITGQKAPIYVSDSSSPVRASSPIIEARQSVGKMYRKWTSLAHPVKFLADCRDGSRPCHWCNNFAYGIVGLGPRFPEIWESDDGTMLEHSDGHVAEGKEKSRMCFRCTWSRFNMLRCSHKTLAPLPSAVTAKTTAQRAAAFANLNRAENTLIDPETGKTGPSFPASDYEWCSLCQEPAFGSCQTLQPVDVYAEVVECDEETYGCGLMLCKNCHDLTNRFKGDLNAVIAWDRNGPARKTSYRADMEYLLPAVEHNTIYNNFMRA